VRRRAAWGSPRRRWARVVAGLYPINGSGLTANNGNYLFVQAAGNAIAFTIGSQAALVITADNKTKTYGAALPTFTASFAGFISGDTAASVTGLQFSSTATLSSNVGTFTITPFGATAPAYYLVGYVPGTLTINPAALTLSGTRVYNGTTFFAGSNLTATGVNGETFMVSGAGDTTNLTTKNVQTNQSLASVTGLAVGVGNTGAALATNYNSLTTTGSTVSVTAASLTASTSNVVKTYNGDTTAAGTAVVTAGTLFGTDSLSGGTFAFTTKDAGAANKTVTVSGISVSDGNSGNNYALTPANNTTSTINPATLTYTATAASRLVGAGDPAFSGTVTGFVNSETQASATTGSMGFATTALGASVAGLYPINGSGLTANNGNYLFVQAAGNAIAFTIGSQAALVITADNKTKTYGAALPTFTASFAGFISGDTAASVTGLQFSSTATLSSNVGTFTITPFGATAPAYYLVGYVPGTLTINPAALTLSGTRVYNGTTFFAGSNLTATGVNGETFMVSGAGDTTNLTTKNVQTNQSLASVTGLAVGVGNTGAALATNYNSLTTTGSTVSVTAASLTASTSNVVKTYNGDTTAAGTAVVTAGTLFGTDSLSGGTFAFTTKDAGAANKTVTVSGISVSDGNSGNNYALTPANNTTSTINPATLTYTATAASRLVGAGDPAFSGTVTGFVNSETQASATTGSMGFATTALGASVAGLYPINGSGLTANNGNYLFVQAAGNAIAFTIGSQAALVITADNKTKTYGAALPTFTASFAGFISGDTAASVTGLQFSSTATLSSNVGTFTITPFGATAPAYYLVGYVPGTLTINPAALTLSGTRVYNGTTFFAGSNLTATGVNGETFTVSGAGDTTNLTTKNVQTNQSLASVTGLAVGVGNTGAALATNYNSLTTTGSTVSVTAASLTASTSNVVKTYNGDTTAAGTAVVTAGTLFGTDSLSGGTFAFTTKDAGAANKTVTVSGISVSDGNSGNNYALTPANNTTSTINPATLTYTATAASRLVGAGDPAFSGTVTGFVNSETQASATTGSMGFATTALGASVAGLYPINGSGLTANNGNYLFVQAAGNAIAFTIGSQAALVITADNKTKTYGAALPTFTASFAGFISGDTAASVTGLQFSSTATLSSNVGTFTITPFGATAPAYYLVGYVPGTLTINPAALTYTATAANRFVGASDPAFSGTVTGFVNSDTQNAATTGTLRFDTTATIASVAGRYPLNGSGLTANNGNYLFVQAAGNALAFTIGTQVPLTITADPKSKTYGAALPTFTASFAGFISGDTAASVTGLQFSTTATASSNVGTFTITPFGATAPATYLVGYVPGTLTINPAALTIAASNVCTTYGYPLPAFDASYSGLVNGDTASVVSGLSLNSSATTHSNIGDYAITPGGGSAQNYAINYQSGVLSVNPATLTITAASGSRAFGAANPVFTATLAGLVNGDTASVVSGLSLNSSATTHSNIGDYAITPGGGSAQNYAINYQSGVLSVNPATLTITAASGSRAFGAALPAYTATIAGFVNGDTAASVTGLQFNTTAAMNSNVGTFTITPFGATAPVSYLVGYVPGTLTISPAALVLTANSATPIYGAVNPAFSATFGSFVNGDNTAVVSGLTFTTPAPTTSAVGDHAITPLGATAAN
jgi:hypothetical protein